MAEPYYTTAADLRAALGVDDTVLPDPKAISLIETAEDLIDHELGARPVDPATGRKVVIADIAEWQANKLARATHLLASRLYAKPDLLTTARYTRVKGPDFELQGPIDSVRGDEVDVLIGALGLYVEATVASGIGVLGVDRAPARRYRDWGDDQTLLGHTDDPYLPE